MSIYTEKQPVTRDEVMQLLIQPFNDLLHQAHTLHRNHFNPNAIQVSTLLSIKTGACPEDCKYCPQSGHYHADLEKQTLIDLATVRQEAEAAKALGATRFCMGAAWRSPTAKDMPKVVAMVEAVKATGLETCMTLGMLAPEQADTLANAGLDYYNHNLDTSPDYYHNIITTRTFDDRLETLEHVRASGMKVCTGGILGMGEAVQDRADLLVILANMEPQPESVPINELVRVPGTPLENALDLDPLDFIRTIAVARLLLPDSYIRLSAGREAMSDSQQALALHAGANSVFYGERLLTTENPALARDHSLLKRLGLMIEGGAEA